MDVLGDPATREGAEMLGPQQRQGIDRQRLHAKICRHVELLRPASGKQIAAEMVDTAGDARLRAAEIERQSVDGDAAGGGIVMSLERAGCELDPAFGKIGAAQHAGTDDQIAIGVAQGEIGGIEGETYGSGNRRVQRGENGKIGSRRREQGRIQPTERPSLSMSVPPRR